MNANENLNSDTLCVEGQSDVLLDIRNLTAIYRTAKSEVHAVNNISLSLRKGEVLGLVGETGAGKTSTALSVMQLLPERTGFITGGQILFEGENLLEKSKAEMRMIRGEQISMIFQDPMTALNPVQTVGTQILESLQIHNSLGNTEKEMDERVDELLKLVGIQPNRKNDYPHQFSGGMKQRVVIAIALACEPKLLIADEPTTALDVTIQAQVLALMNELKEKIDTSIIMITHDFGIVAQTCDKVSVMYAGEIIENGTTAAIFDGENHHPYTTGLFNSIPNLYDDTDRLKPIRGLMPDPINLPSGCHFHPRCDHCMDICKKIHPEPHVMPEGHIVFCHLFD